MAKVWRRFRFRFAKRATWSSVMLSDSSVCIFAAHLAHCSIIQLLTGSWVLTLHFAQHSKMPAHCASKQRWSLNPLWSQVVYGEVMITIWMDERGENVFHVQMEKSEPRYNADYLVEMYSTHKQAISSRCIQHTRKLSRGDVFSTQANYLVEMYSSHRLSHGDVFSKQAYYFAEKTFQRRISYGHIYSTHNISYKRCIQHCRIFCSVDVFNNAGYFAQWTYSTMQDILLRGCIQHIISRTEEACNPDYPVERAYWTQKNSHRKYIFRPDIYCICRGQHKFRQNRMSSVILYREYRSIHQPDTDGVFTSLARSVWFHQSSP